MLMITKCWLFVDAATAKRCAQGDCEQFWWPNIIARYVRTHTRGIDKNTENKLKKRKLDSFFAAY